MVTISVDPYSDQYKMDQLFGGALTLLADPGLQVIRAYQMEHKMGADTVGNMGYVIIDGAGQVRELVVDPLFGRHASKIIDALKGLQ